MPQVAIFMGSKSDEAAVRPCADILDKLGITYFFTVTSAHRTPERTATLVRDRGTVVVLGIVWILPFRRVFSAVGKDEE